MNFVRTLLALQLLLPTLILMNLERQMLLRIAKQKMTF